MILVLKRGGVEEKGTMIEDLEEKKGDIGVKGT